MIAHVSGVPLEEILLPVLSAFGGGLFLVGNWLISRIRRPPG